VIKLVRELDEFERQNRSLTQRNPRTLIFDSFGNIVNSISDSVKSTPGGVTTDHIEVKQVGVVVKGPYAKTVQEDKKMTITTETQKIDSQPTTDPAKPNLDPSKSSDSSGPKTYEVKDIKTFTAKDVLQILEQSKVLEIAGLTIWDRIVSELVSFGILISFLVFFGLGYFVFSTNSQFISSLTTVVVFVVGQGVSIPLRSTEKDKANFGQSLQAAAQAQTAQTAATTKKTQ